MYEHLHKGESALWRESSGVLASVCFFFKLFFDNRPSALIDLIKA